MEMSGILAKTQPWRIPSDTCTSATHAFKAVCHGRQDSNSNGCFLVAWTPRTMAMLCGNADLICQIKILCGWTRAGKRELF